jgi:hypothetical protein
MKRGTQHSIIEAHFDRYLAEWAFKCYIHKINDAERAVLSAERIAGKRLTRRLRHIGSSNNA